MAAAHQAMNDSGLVSDGNIDAFRLATYVGSGIGGFQSIYREVGKMYEDPSGQWISPNFDPIIILTMDDVLLNASISEIGQKLHFEYGSAQNPEALYSEAQPGGYLNVVKNDSLGESQVNIEALFNTVLRNKKTIKEMFSTKGGLYE